MPKGVIAVLLALGAALLSAVGDVIRQRSAQEITDKPVGHLTLFRISLRDTRWWLGSAVSVTNYGLQIAALALASVMLVTALQVTAILFALPLYARLTHHRVSGWEWMWAALLSGALAVLVAVGDPQAGQSRGSAAIWAVVAVVMGPGLVLAVLAARIWPERPPAAVLLAMVAGSFWALFAVLIKGIIEAFDAGFGALLCAPELYGWLLVALLGNIFQQSSFRAGALTASMPTMIVAEPLVAAVLGVTVLGETLDAAGLAWLTLAAAAVLVIVATVALARGEAATMAARAGRDVKTTDQPTLPGSRGAVPCSSSPYRAV
jgi:drug/metabolite transporter (DMT)-like permease